jgi:hypothetical protein
MNSAMAKSRIWFQPGLSLPGWRFSIDRGGTFTDLVGHGPAGEWVVSKVL